MPLLAREKEGNTLLKIFFQATSAGGESLLDRVTCENGSASMAVQYVFASSKMKQFSFSRNDNLQIWQNWLNSAPRVFRANRRFFLWKAPEFKATRDYERSGEGECPTEKASSLWRHIGFDAAMQALRKSCRYLGHAFIPVQGHDISLTIYNCRARLTAPNMVIHGHA